jgi:hypothetical protein
MRHQYNFVRVEEIRDMLAEIEAADDAETLGALYLRHIGYDIFKEPQEGDNTEDFDDIRMVLTDFIREVAYSEGIHWADIDDIECR